jgi:NitT/TauT family transport system substrate-binding protein
VVSAAARGADIQIIASTHPKHYTSLSVSKDVPLPNLSKGYPAVMKDLKGRKVGVTVRGSAVELQVKALLAGAGMQPDDVTFVAVGSPGTAYASLLAKQIDAAMMFQPFKAICEVQQTCVTPVDLSKNEGPKDLLALNGAVQYVAATRQFIEKNPVVVQALIQALDDAVRWIKDPANAAEVLGVMQNNYVIGKEIAKGGEVMKALAVDETAGAGVAIDRNAVKAYVAYMVKHKLIDKPLDAGRLVYQNAPRP